jgi:IS30 family transposase
MKKLTDEQIVRAREWRQQGVAWAEIGRRFNVKYDTVQRAIDPKFQAYDGR